jgi:beta-glucosidase
MGESLDRGSLSLPQNQDQLIRAVARANPNTIVVLTTGSAVTMPWLNQVAGVMESWYPGGEQGRAVAALLFGDEKFSGKLPISWPRSEEQVTGGLGIDNPYFDINNPGVTVPHDEGVYTGYRGFDRAGLDPLFPFGYGLTTGTVAYRSLQIRDPRQAAPGRPQTGRDGLVRVRVQNTGASATTETVQLYEGKLPTAADTPARQLIGWSRVTLAPRETRWVDIPVKLGTTQHALAYWDTGANAWVTPTGRTSVYIGRSERDIRLTGNITVLAPPGA